MLQEAVDSLLDNGRRGVDLIRVKRDRGILNTEQINWLIDAYTRGYVADEP